MSLDVGPVVGAEPWRDGAVSLALADRGLGVRDDPRRGDDAEHPLRRGVPGIPCGRAEPRGVVPSEADLSLYIF